MGIDREPYFVESTNTTSSSITMSFPFLCPSLDPNVPLPPYDDESVDRISAHIRPSDPLSGSSIDRRQLLETSTYLGSLTADSVKGGGGVGRSRTSHHNIA